MSGHEFGVFIAGLALGVFLGVIAPIPSNDMPDPTPEQMMQIMQIYCGKDGCR